MGEQVERVDEHDEVLGVVDRDEAIRRRWLHRVATVVCHDPAGLVLVHRRPEDDIRFPGRLNWLLGGAVGAGESYEAAAARELAEELGVDARPGFVLKFRCDGAVSPYWLGLHEALVSGAIHPDPAEIAWHAWVTVDELDALVRRPDFLPDGREAYERFRDVRRSPGCP
ncbi:NUDIX domain-containing protein [Streptacidiphilus jiangxiensis]|uniref:Isopentenyldiphosphate isomerase n=1 Tax=Streptacidiphilus jiangxiensis TaxID=235985 RepID=A0A1H7PYM1_STRJI|nr:NUDIX domain-containing protein [Streptacidiphilus jiangxiensis]SEL40659.1 Isopentenyldiphosphate isomerase [Streptacidiphilus jiangxiensis]